MGFSPEKAYPVVRSIFILLVLLSALCAGLHTVADYDMGWQLATGRYVVQHHQISRTDVSVVNFSGKPWAYPPFAGVLLYLRYCAFGSAGLSWDYHRGTRSCPWLLPVLLLFCNCGFTVAISGTAAPREHRKRGLPRLYG